MALNSVPLAGQSLGQTRVPIKTNFDTIDAAFQVDHEDYNTTNQGMHNRVSFLTQSPVPTPIAGVVQLYSQLSAITAQPELVFAHQAGSTAPLAAQIVEFTSAGWANPGWTRLPSGILLKWHQGITIPVLDGFVIVDLNTDVPGSPNFTNVFNVQLTTFDSFGSYNNVIGLRQFAPPFITIATFGFPFPPANVTVGYLAIGM